MKEWKKTELKTIVFCNTVTLALTNKHDTVVGSSPRANHSTLTDGCWDGIKHPAPNRPSRFLACSFSWATPFLPCSDIPLLFHANLFFLLHAAVNIPFLIFSPCSPPSDNSVSAFLPFFLSPLTCPFALYFTPSANTSSSSSGRWFDKKVEEQERKKNVPPTLYIGLHCFSTLLW